MEAILEGKLKRLVGKQVTVKSSQFLFRGILSLKNETYTVQSDGNYINFEFPEVRMVMAHTPIILVGQECPEIVATPV